MKRKFSGSRQGVRSTRSERINKIKPLELFYVGKEVAEQGVAHFG